MGSEPKTGSPDGVDPVADLTPPSVGPIALRKPSQAIQLPATVKGPTTPIASGQQIPETVVGNETPGIKPVSGTAHTHPNVFRSTSSRKPVGILIGWHDLNGERILRDAPRTTYEGITTPTLGGIPLLAKLGQGGMGSVYYGVHPRLNIDVAVKVLPAHLADSDPTLVDRFVREAQIAAQVRSPHLVHVIDVNQDSGQWFLVMEFVYGVSGGKHNVQLRAEQKTLSEADVLDACIAATIGLNAAHDQNVIHRDIKPENIMIPYAAGSTTPVYSSAKLTDLGLARIQLGEGQTGLTGTQSAMGTPGYMAPEQALEARDADARSDIFSMGATIYSLLVGRSPFHRDSPMKTIYATTEEEPDSLSKLRPDVSLALCVAVDKCLEKDPAKRFQTAADLLSELKRIRAIANTSAGAVMEPSTVRGPRPRSKPPQQSSNSTITGPAPLTRRSPIPRLIIIGALFAATLVIVYFVWQPTQTNIEGKPAAQWFVSQLELASAKVSDGKLDDALDVLNKARSRIGPGILTDKESSLRDQILVLKENRKQQLSNSLRSVDQVLASPSATVEEFLGADNAISELRQLSANDPSLKISLETRENSLQIVRAKLEANDLARVKDAISTARQMPQESSKEVLAAARRLIQSSPLLSRSKLREELENEIKALESSPQVAGVAAGDNEVANLVAEVQKSNDVASALVRIDEGIKKFGETKELLDARSLIRSKAERASRTKEVEKYLTVAASAIEKQSDLDSAEKALQSAERIDPSNPSILASWRKLAQVRGEISAKSTDQQKRSQFMKYLMEVDSALNQGVLAEAEEKIGIMEVLSPKDGMIAPLRLRLKDMRDEQKKRALFEDLYTKALQNLGEGKSIDDIRKQLLEAEQLIPKEPRLAAAWAQLEEKKVQISNLQKLEGILVQANEMVKDNSRLVDLRQKLMEAQAIAPNDSRLKDLWTELSRKQQEELEKAAAASKRSEFNALVQALDGLIDRSGDVKDIESKLKRAVELFPKDAEIVRLREKLSARRETQSKPQTSSKPLQVGEGRLED